MAENNVIQALLSTVALEPDEATEIIAKKIYNKLSEYIEANKVKLEVVDYKFLMLKLGWGSAKCSELSKKLRREFQQEYPSEYEQMKYWQGERNVVPFWYYNQKFDWLENEKKPLEATSDE